MGTPDSHTPPVDHGHELLAMIDRLLAGEIPFEVFARTYYDYFFDSVPGDSLEPSVLDFFSAVAEKLDLTGSDPDEVSRSYGWGDPGQFLSWLRQFRSTYPG